ncbi:MAG: hypothetical protein V3T20_03660 [Gemmatimonadota bacterium]
MRLLTRPGRRETPPPLAYWWSLTAAYHILGDHEQELVEAQHALEQHPNNMETLTNAFRVMQRPLR